MVKLKGEPGPYIPYETVECRVKDPVYGAAELVALGLFHSEHFVRDAINTNKLKAKKIGKRSVVICRNDLLDYWKKWRHSPFETANNTIYFRLTISEADFIGGLVKMAQNRVDKNFTKDDLFRNVVQELRECHLNEQLSPKLFTRCA